MKIILSRKGFDSQYGGVPSAIFPDGRMCWLPIPQPGSSVRFEQLQWNGWNVGEVVEELTRNRLQGDDGTHCDPDLDRHLLTRKPGWKPIFGQGNARAHLDRFEVGVGDLFLFFGWFR